MRLVEALEVLRGVRREEVVITTMAAAREWMKLGHHPLDFVLVPSSMGQATALGLGIALAKPERPVIVCNGDGSMLMNLGSLVTITAHGPENLIVILFDNGVYEVTGVQPTLAAPGYRADRLGIDFADIATSCGFRHVWTFDEVEPWRKQVAAIINGPGPVFVHLLVEPMSNATPLDSPGHSAERARAFRTALQSPTQK